ncbi:restriction endonuclease subunit S [Fulvivirga maritima]|uniref:restriction endonuclease subunit S n=1 Tax=Fulvivirga maritima TaxID=2904247 RepID=UPI001F2EC2E6|nr:restriction endonuclease subunit S [Fulvivirga maritima]UII26317.1 restriction endonuclease subunit S [Fulvivirga maritima]
MFEKKEVKMVPKLRFKEFEDIWNNTKLGVIGSFRGGGTPSTKHNDYWNGDVPWISSSDVKESDILNLDINRFLNHKAIKESATKIIPANSVLFVSRVGVGKLAVNKKELCTSQDFANLTPKKDISQFIAYYFLANNNLLHRYSQGTSIKGFTTGDLKSIPLNLPSLPEQKKIADFLSAVDKKIEQLTRKKELLEQYKKGLMQKLFAQEIRFKDDNDEEFPEWEEKRLGSVFERVKRKNKENNLNVLTISAQQGLVNQEDYFNKSVSAKDVTGYYLLHKGEFAYNKSYSKGYPLGAIKRLDKYEKGVVSTLYICFKLNENNDSDYFMAFLEHGSINHELHKIAQEGARNHGLLNLSVVEFFNDIKFKTPSLREQVKIGQFLKSLSDKIYIANQELEKDQTFKKGLLQQMFV